MENCKQKVKFLDVGHADSSVIYLSDNSSNYVKTLIIDIADADKLINELALNHIKIIDMIIISHFDADHCKGVNDFLEKFAMKGIVKTICFNIDRNIPTKTMKLILKRLIELYHKQKATLINGTIDSDMTKRELISVGNTKIFLLYPNIADEAKMYLLRSTNDMSVVCLLENEICNILFPGDLEKQGWSDLLEHISDLKCDILKMPHHGAFYSDIKGPGTNDILETLNPRIAIISTGENKQYNHPNDKTIQLLKEKNIQIYCTEYTNLCHCSKPSLQKNCHGDISVEITESNYLIKTENNNKTLLEHPLCIRQTINYIHQTPIPTNIFLIFFLNIRNII